MKIKQFLIFMVVLILSFIPMMAGILVGLLVKYWFMCKAAFLEGYEYGAKW